MLKRFIIRQIARFYLKKKDLAGRIGYYFPTYSSIFIGALNELSYRIGLSRSFRVQNIVVELTNTCNLKCNICAINGAMRRKAGFMSRETYRVIIDKNPGLKLITFVGWGEQLLHPHFFDFLHYAKSRNIVVGLTTNGTLLSPDIIKRLIASNLDHITISMDGIDEVYTAIRGYDYHRIESHLLNLLQLREKAKSKITVEINCAGTPQVLAQREKIRERWQGKVDSIRISSYLEYVKPAKTNRRFRCRELWRGMISVCWDGTVIPCCMDFNASMPIGNCHRDSLQLIWNDNVMMRLRQNHKQGIFLERCATCYEYAGSDISERFLA